jgi:hypothetical protein
MAISFGLSIWSLNYMIAKMDPDRQSKQASKLQKKRLEQQLGRKCAFVAAVVMTVDLHDCTSIPADMSEPAYT